MNSFESVFIFTYKYIIVINFLESQKQSLRYPQSGSGFDFMSDMGDLGHTCTQSKCIQEDFQELFVWRSTDTLQMKRESPCNSPDDNKSNLVCRYLKV